MQGFPPPPRLHTVRPRARRQDALAGLFRVLSACLAQSGTHRLCRPPRIAWYCFSLALIALAPWQARATDIEYRSAATYNMQGSSTAGGSKWTSDVVSLMAQHEILALQEAGVPPSSAILLENVQTPQGLFQHFYWSVGTSTRPRNFNIYWLQTDPNGNRNNLAIVLGQDSTGDQIVADEWTTVPEGIPGQTRPALGVRVGATWWYSIHASASGGGDVSSLLSNINRAPNYNGTFWVALGDFNRSPSVSLIPYGSEIYNTGAATQQSGGELDWMVSSDVVNCNVGSLQIQGRRLSALSSDHYPIDFIPVPCFRARGPNSTLGSLRILPLGDSITWGFKSTTGSGYRAPLDLALTMEKATVQYVGSQISGNSPDNLTEGYPGKKIAYLTAIAPAALRQYRPNVVLLEAGANDMIDSNESVSSAIADMNQLIETIVTEEPDVTLLVGTVTRNSDPAVEARIEAFNEQLYSQVSEAHKTVSSYVGFVSMDAVELADLADGLHPNDTGYAKMAGAFNFDINVSSSAGWLEPPVPCDQTPYGCHNLTSRGNVPPGPGPGPGSWADQGEVASGIGVDGSTVQFADINGDGKADYLAVDAGSGGVTAYFNGGRAADGHMIWYPQGQLASGVAPGAQIQFADIDGDGRADYLIVDPASGALSAYLNGGPNPNGGWIWYPQGQLASGLAPGAQIQFADINGDGRADYLIVDPTSGALTAYFNGGRAADGHMIWYPQGQLASGVGAPKGSKVLFGDINADGYADYLVISADDGSVHAWLNQGPITGGGWDWVPQGQIAPGNGIAAARFYVHEADIDGDGRVDYVTVASNSSVHVWLNQGNDKTRPAAWLPLGAIASGVSDSSSTVFLKDLDGDGRADYISINQTTGGALAYINGGANPSGGWIWYPLSSPLTSGVGAALKSIYQFGDINGDGKTDYLVVDPATGRTDAWLNGGKGTDGRWIWYPYGIVNVGYSGADFTGVKSVGAAVRFADITGDGLDDYIVLNTNTGDAWYTINQGSALSYFTQNRIPQLAFATGLGGNVTFAKLNYDKQADYIVVNTQGNVFGFLNGGLKSNDTVNWLGQGQIASGTAAPGPTTSITFADLNGDGRADYIVLDPTNGAIKQAWLNNGGGLPVWDQQ